MDAIFLFRRDLRLHDNLALYKLSKNKDIKNIYFVFIFTPEQTNPDINKYFTKSGFDFMITSLLELSNKIHINFYYGDYIDTLESILTDNIKYIYFNHDYSNYSHSRDVKIFKLGKKYDIKVNAYHDLFLNKSILEKGYKVMNAYVKRILKFKISKLPAYDVTDKAKKLKSSVTNWRSLFKDVEIQTLKNPKQLVLKHFKIKGLGTRVGPYVKFGLISCRELYLLDTSDEYKREVIIREFFYQCMIYYRNDIKSVPNNWVSPFYNSDIETGSLKKISIKSFYTRDGAFTKLPELIQTFIIKLIDTNYLHNRERMMLATYLVHELGVNWKKCERFYANNLQDYDYVLNQLNWMWVMKVFFHTRPNIMKLKNFHY